MTPSPPRRARGRGAVSASPGSRSGADALREGHGRAPEARCPIRTHEATDALARSRMSAHPLRHRVLHLPALVWVVCRCGPRGNVCVDPAVPTPTWGTPRSQLRGDPLASYPTPGQDAAGLLARDGGGGIERGRDGPQPEVGSRPCRAGLGEGAAAAWGRRPPGVADGSSSPTGSLPAPRPARRVGR
jgi:hypothetical protein